MYELYSRRFLVLKLIFWLPYWVDLRSNFWKLMGITFFDPSTPSRRCHFHLEAPLYANAMALSAKRINRNNNYRIYDSLKGETTWRIIHNYLSSICTSVTIALRLQDGYYIILILMYVVDDHICTFTYAPIHKEEFKENSCGNNCTLSCTMSNRHPYGLPHLIRYLQTA